MPARVSLTNAWALVVRDWADLVFQYHHNPRGLDTMLSHITNLQSGLKVLRRKIQAQKRKEAQGG